MEPKFTNLWEILGAFRPRAIVDSNPRNQQEEGRQTYTNCNGEKR